MSDLTIEQVIHIHHNDGFRYSVHKFEDDSVIIEYTQESDSYTESMEIDRESALALANAIHHLYAKC